MYKNGAWVDRNSSAIPTINNFHAFIRFYRK